MTGSGVTDSGAEENRMEAFDISYRPWVYKTYMVRMYFKY